MAEHDSGYKSLFSHPEMVEDLLRGFGLLYQDLLKRGETTPSGKLPPVLPLVLYNGYAPWGPPGRSRS